LMTPLGMPVEPEVKRIFAVVFGESDENAASTSGPGERCSNRSSGVAVAPTADSGAANRAGSLANKRPGSSSSKMYFSFA
jgi:hypothetical protein